MLLMNFHIIHKLMFPHYFDHIDNNFTSFIFQLFHQLVFGDKCKFNATVSTLLFLNAISLFHFFQSIALVSVRIIHLVVYNRTSSNSSIGTPSWPLRLCGTDDINFYKFWYFFFGFQIWYLLAHIADRTVFFMYE